MSKEHGQRMKKVRNVNTRKDVECRSKRKAQIKITMKYHIDSI